MKRETAALITIIGALTLAAPSIARAVTVHNIKSTRHDSKMIEIAIAPLESRSNARAGIEFAKVVSFDLKFSGYFDPSEDLAAALKSAERDKARGSIDFASWRKLTSHFLLKGAIETDPGKRGKVTLSASIYNVGNGANLFRKRYTGYQEQLRLMAHMVSDDILDRFTGEKGVATTRIAYTSRLDRGKDLFMIDYDGANRQRLTNDRSLVLFPAFSQRKNQILFTSYTRRNPDLYLLDLISRERSVVSKKLGLNTTGEFDPVGDRIVFSLSYRGNSEIYIVNADGSGARKITQARSIETSPTFSPDGRSIAFTSDRNGSPQIYVMRDDGSDVRRMTHTGRYNESPTWSPTGDYIAFSSLGDGNFDIAMIDATDLDRDRARPLIHLTNQPGNDESPSFSPRGRHIVFSSNRSGTKQLYLMNRSGANQTQLTSSSGGAFSPSWGGSILDALTE